MVGNYLASIVFHSVEPSIHLSALNVCLTITMKLIKSQRTERKTEGGHERIRGQKPKPQTFKIRERSDRRQQKDR